MSTVTLTINNLEVAVPAGSTILDAAAAHDIPIPTLCHLNGYEHATSCMLCVVHDVQADRLLPSCSAPVSEGLRIETESEKVRTARKDALDLLLSEHVGDCRAPCTRVCPAGMDIPLMIRQIENRQFEEALITVKNDIALPAVLGRICSAPCEKGCHRRWFDDPVSVCALHRYVADVDLARERPYVPEVPPPTGKRVAILGAGPAGLSAAYYLARYGHACHVYDQNPRPGGMLRYGVPEELLPRSVLDAEIERIAELGVAFLMKRTLGKDLTWQALKSGYDAVVLAIGVFDAGLLDDTGVEVSKRGVTIDRYTFETNIPGVFAGGDAVIKSRTAIRASAHGRFMAISVDQYLKGEPVTGAARPFLSIVKKIGEEDFDEVSKEAEDYPRQTQGPGVSKGYAEEEAVVESSRCFGCDCRKAGTCKLRQYAEAYDADPRRFAFPQRKAIEKVIQHDLIVYEPGKCIKCGLCVQVTKKHGEDLGLAFVDRGFDLRVQTPFGKPLSEGLRASAAACICYCPTGALAWRDRTNVFPCHPDERSEEGSQH